MELIPVGRRGINKIPLSRYYSIICLALCYMLISSLSYLAISLG